MDEAVKGGAALLAPALPFDEAGLYEENAGWLAAALLVAGVFLGSAGWWLLLAGGTATLLRGRLTSRHMLWINRCAGTLIAGFGVAAIARGLGIA
jgi:putative LysE/RhtB family amino acid efflux pump